MVKRISFFSIIFLILCISIPAQTVKVFRIQFGAFNDAGSALECIKKLEEKGITGCEVVVLEGSFKFKVKGPVFENIDSAREYLSGLNLENDPDFSGAFPTECIIDENEASLLGVTIPETLFPELMTMLDLSGNTKSTSELLEAGNRCIKEGNWEDALEAFATITVTDPESGEACEATFRIGRIYYSLYFNFINGTEDMKTPDMPQRALLSAKEQFEKILNEYSNCKYTEKARYFLGLTERHLGQYGISSQSQQRAYELVTESIKSGENTPWQRLQQLDLLLVLAKTDLSLANDVIEMASRYLEDFPEASEGQRARAEVMHLEIFYHLKDFEEVIKLADKMTPKYSDFDAMKPCSTALALSAECCYDLGRYEEASSRFIDLINKYSEPGYTFKSGQHLESAHCKLGICNMKLGRFDDAIEWFMRCEELYPGTIWDEMSMVIRTNCYIEKGEKDKAKETYNIFRKKFPDSREMCFIQDRLIEKGIKIEDER